MAQKQVVFQLSDKALRELDGHAKTHGRSRYAMLKGIVGKWLSDHRRTDEVDAETIDLIAGQKYATENRALGRELSELLTMYKDRKHTLATYAQLIIYGNHGYKTTDDLMFILDKVLLRLLPANVKKKLRQYALIHDGCTLSTALIEMIGEYNIDTVGYEINQEFEEMVTEASATEAFNRGLR